MLRRRRIARGAGTSRSLTGACGVGVGAHFFFFALADLSPCRVRTHVATHSGQYGVVYKAVYVPLNARLAVKVIDLRRPQFSGKALLRLREEIKIMERVQHVRGRAARRVVWAPATLTRACTTVATAGRAMACAAQHYPAACDV